MAADPGPGFRNLEGTCFPSGTREATFYVFGCHPSIVLGLPRLDGLRNNSPNFSSEDGPFRVWERPTFRPCLYFISLSRPQNCQGHAEINLHTITTAAMDSGKRHRRSQAPLRSRHLSRLAHAPHSTVSPWSGLPQLSHLPSSFIDL